MTEERGRRFSEFRPGSRRPESLNSNAAAVLSIWRSQSAHTIAPQSSFRQYLRARYYDAGTGTFNRLDPFFGKTMDPQSFHKYLYAHGDPVNNVDPTGLWSDSGHFYTVYVLASMAGLEHAEARELAFWAQYPDEENAYNAAWLTMRRSRMRGGHTWASISAAASAVNATVEDISSNEWELLLHMRQHQLTAGRGTMLLREQGSLEVLYRRARRRNRVQEMGLLLHAYGDSFAHTFADPETGRRTAYPPIKGHGGARAPYSGNIFDGPPGSAVDNIAERYADGMYPEYVRSMARLIGVQDANEVERLIEYMAPHSVTDNVFFPNRIWYDASKEHGGIVPILIPYTPDHEVYLLANYKFNRQNDPHESYRSNEALSGLGDYRPETDDNQHMGRHIDFSAMRGFLESVQRAHKRNHFVIRRGEVGNGWY